jgi:hypothetical protein
MSEDNGEFEIADWISMTKITEDGAKKLEKCMVKDLAMLLLFRESDVDSLKLTLTDSLRFRDGIEKLHKVSNSMPSFLDDKGNIVPKPKVKTEPTDADEKI